jgi:anti-sigma factor RsiW
MDCNETRRLLEAHLDGELDLVRHTEIEAHVRECPACAQFLANAEQRRTALREGLPRFSAPPALAEKIRAALPIAMPSLEAREAPRPSRPANRSFFQFWQFAGVAAGFAVALFVGFRWGGARERENLVFDEAVAGHVRSLQVDHLTDVASTDQHTVKPWFAGKLDFSPPVVDLAAAGYPLTGGRIEQMDGRPAAALVFHRRQHAINLFIWPATRAPLTQRRTEQHGYHTESWSSGGLNFLAISEIPADEVAAFSAAFRAQAQ